MLFLPLPGITSGRSSHWPQTSFDQFDSEVGVDPSNGATLLAGTFLFCMVVVVVDEFS